MNNIFNNYDSENDERLDKKFSYNYQVIKNVYPKVSKLPEDEVREIIRKYYDATGTHEDSMQAVMNYIHEKEPEWKRQGLLSKTTDDSSEPYLEFNGRNLRWMENGEEKYSWPAMSGSPEYQDRMYQARRNEGPLPEGEWNVEQNRLQHYDDLGNTQKWLASKGRGKWPTGTSSWGNHRAWIEPSENTYTYGRSGLAIHGGDSFGSNGCIDLSTGMDDFNDKYSNYGRNMKLKVRYDKDNW